MQCLSWSAPLSDSLLLLSATRGGLFTSCHLLPHVGEQSVLTRSTVHSISPAPVTRFPFPIYSCLCPLSVSVCLFVFRLTLHVEISWTPVYLFLPVIRPVGVDAGSQFFPQTFCSVFGCSHPKFLINFIPLFCIALESSDPYTQTCVTEHTDQTWTQLETLRSTTLSHNRGSSSDVNRRRYRHLIKPWPVYLNNSPL